MTADTFDLPSLEFPRRSFMHAMLRRSHGQVWFDGDTGLTTERWGKLGFGFHLHNKSFDDEGAVVVMQGVTAHPYGQPTDPL